MKKFRLFAAFISLILLAVSCKDSDNPVLGTPGGEFKGSITMYDDAGGIFVKGTIYIKQDESNKLTGNWSFSNNGSGNLEGTLNEGTISINLNPNMVDNNTFLFGKVVGRIITGSWTYSGFAGPLRRGTFSAIEE